MTDYDARRGDLVLIIEDCRPGAPAVGQIGTMEGQFSPPGRGQPSPRIRLQDGTAIWGCQCWWRWVEDAGALVTEQEALERWKAVLRLMMQPNTCAPEDAARIAAHD